MIVSWDGDSGSWLYFSIFHPFFFLSPNYKLTLRVRVRVFLGTKARMLNLLIHMDNELLYCGIENQIPCSYSSLYLSIFLSFKAKYVSQFSPELCELDSSNMVNICRMSDFIVGLRLRVIAFIFLFLSIFLSFPILHVNNKNFYVGVFSGTFKARILKLGIHRDNQLLYCGIENGTPCSYSSLYLSLFLSFMAKFVSQFSPELCKLEPSNMVYICRMSDCIMGWRPRVMALIFLFLSIFLSFPILHVNIKNLCWSFLRNF